jgi:hypothetical protein
MCEMPQTWRICYGWAGCRRRGSPRPAARRLREAVRHRAKLVGLRSGLKAQVHAVLAKQGAHVPMSDLFGAGGQQLLDGLRLDPAYNQCKEL